MQLTSGYEITARCHESSRSLIYRGYHTDDRRPVIIKAPSEETSHPGKLMQLRREYEIGRKMNSPHVIAYYDLISFDGSQAIVMEDFGAEALSRHIPPEGLEPEAFLKLAVQIVAGLEAIHNQHVIHKDVKPSNLVIEGGRVKWIDFGLSSLFTRETMTTVSPGMLQGTPAYISPEQTGRMNRGIDYRSDFYSLGITFYQMLTGSPCFTSQDPMELVHQHIAKEPIPAHTIKPSIPRVVSDIVLKLLAKEPEHRYQSVAGLEADLERCLHDMDSPASLSFPLGSRDVSHLFLIPDKLYGREKELRVIDDCLEAVTSGVPEFLLITGPSGAGKSMLVNEIRGPLTGRRGYFTSGKFDELNRDVAYSAISKAFGELVKQILGESGRELKRWRRHLEDALGDHAAVLSDIFPELSLLVDPGKPPPALGPRETTNRLNRAFSQFVGVCARAEHPLVLFIDDLQWADPASLQLIEALVGERSKHHLLLIGAYRDNEIGPGHALAGVLTSLTEKGCRPRELKPAPLQQDHLAQLTADTLHAELQAVEPLARNIFAKTGGNPFFAVTFLKSLYQEGLIRFDHATGSWRWDLDQISQLASSPNVVTFLLERLRRLPKPAVHLSALASCIGDRFDLRTLAALAGRTMQETLTDLWPAMENEIVAPLNHHHLIHESSGPSLPDAFADIDIHFRFQHDRVREAAYCMLDESERQNAHYRIGRALLAGLKEEEVRERLFEITGHLNEAKSLQAGCEERLELCRLNLAAGAKAAASSAFEQALNHLTHAMDLLPEDPWRTDYSLAFSTAFDRCRYAFICGELETAEPLRDLLLARAETRFDRARVFEMCMANYILKGAIEDAAEAGFQALRLLGVRLSLNPGRFALLLETRRVNRLLAGRSVDDLARLPLLDNPEAELIIRILMSLVTPAYAQGRERFLCVIILKRLALTLRYGMNPLTPNTFAHYGIVLALRGELDQAIAYTQLALTLQKRFGDPFVGARVYQTHTVLGLGWKQHRRRLGPGFLKVMELARQSGDMVYQVYGSMGFIYWNPSPDLASIIASSERHLDFIREANFPDILDPALVFHHFHLSLRGETEHPLSLSREGFQEDALLQRTKDSQFNMGFIAYHIIKLRLCCIYGDYEKGVEHFREATGPGGWLGTPLLAELCFYGFLARAASARNASPAKRASTLRELKGARRQMEQWAAQAPNNFLCCLKLMEAETARLKDRLGEAPACYNQAVEAARENDYPYLEALVHEHAAAFYLNWGDHKGAAGHLEDALRCYRIWGAEAKVTWMRQHYAHLLQRESPGNREAFTLESDTISATTTLTLTEAPTVFSESEHSTHGTSSDGGISTGSADNLDYRSVLKSSLAIAGEITSDAFLAKMMMITIENAGASRGILVLDRLGSLQVAATAGVDQRELPEEGRPLDEDSLLPLSIVRFVLGSGNRVLLADAAQDRGFGQDPYIQNQAVCSVLCLPIVRNRRTLGVLYLENTLVKNAFTTQRIEVLKVLLNQAVVSLENAMLYQDAKNAEARLSALNDELEARVQQRTAALEAAQKELVESAHAAGMASVATSVLHNVGNVLNPITISSQMIMETIEGSKMRGIAAVNRLLDQHRDHLADFFTDHPKGKKLVDYFLKLERAFEEENQKLRTNASRLVDKVNAVRDVIMAQQEYAVAGVHHEELVLCRVVEDALLLQESSLARHGITVEKHYRGEPVVRVDKVKLIHILFNILKNAVEATEESREKRITIRIEVSGESASVKISDTGRGISSEQIDSIFQHGFTTKQDGHGFGLHSCAVAMTEMGGNMKVESAGPGRGACFILLFPSNRNMVSPGQR
ncbi:MAG: AAA family ATPase [Acidobacteriota bacterium]|nr:AAA family ATPase [Acidobacteriota bacterium]